MLGANPSQKERTRIANTAIRMVTYTMRCTASASARSYAEAQGLHRAPETMREVEPDGHDPEKIENGINRIGKGVLDPGETVGGVVSHFDVSQLGKHHVSPEIVQVENETQQYDNTHTSMFCEAQLTSGRRLVTS
jgi:hypothetical protein